MSSDYFNTDTFSDVVIVCEDQEFKVHKLVLACHSKYFEKQLNGNWKVWRGQLIRIPFADYSEGKSREENRNPGL